MATGDYRCLGSATLAYRVAWMQRDALWVQYRGVFLVLFSQLFSALMNVATRLLQTSDSSLHPLQILFFRMSITGVTSLIYTWKMHVEDSPLGKREVRGLLIIRAIGGFFGVFGLYYSLAYLPIADVTVITFLAPLFSGYMSSMLMKQPFTVADQIAGCTSLFGIILITKPISVSSLYTHNPLSYEDYVPEHDSEQLEGDNIQRAIAVGVGLIGVSGSATALTSIRWIGKQTHPLIAVNYFVVGTAILSGICLLLFRDIGGFKTPTGLREWVLLLFISISGFTMQCLLTAGLQSEKSFKATSMIYTQIIFALAFDRLVWGHIPDFLSISGSFLVMASSIWAALCDKRTSATLTSIPTRNSDEETLMDLNGAENAGMP